MTNREADDRRVAAIKRRNKTEIRILDRVGARFSEGIAAFNVRSDQVLRQPRHGDGRIRGRGINRKAAGRLRSDRERAVNRMRPSAQSAERSERILARNRFSKTDPLQRDDRVRGNQDFAGKDALPRRDREPFFARDPVAVSEYVLSRKYRLVNIRRKNPEWKAVPPQDLDSPRRPGSQNHADAL